MSSTRLQDVTMTQHEYSKTKVKSDTSLMSSYPDHEQRIICADRELSKTLLADSELVISKSR